MTYLETHNRARTRRSKVVATVVGILVVVIVAAQVLTPHLLPALFTSIARPFWRTEFSVGSGSLESFAALLNENEGLKRQLDQAQAGMKSVQAVEDENAELKALMGRASTTPYILAAVLKEPPFSDYDELVIDAGQDHGFMDGDMVYAAGNIPVGRVSNVLAQTSSVTLFSSPGQEFDALIGSSHLPATVIGRGGGQYEAELPRDSNIAKGDYVIIPSLDNSPFGIVTSVAADPSQPFETVLFAPPINIYELRWVLVDARAK